MIDAADPLFRDGRRLRSRRRFHRGRGLLARGAFGVPPFRTSLQNLLLQFFSGRMNGVKQVSVRPDTYQLVMVVIDGDLSLLQMPFYGKNDVRFVLALSVQEFADF